MNRFKEKLSNIKNKIIETTNNAINSPLSSITNSSSSTTQNSNNNVNTEDNNNQFIPSSSTQRKKKKHRRRKEPVFKFVQVQNTDSLMSIARKYNMTEEDLMIVNRLDSKSIYQGQMLMVCLNFKCCHLPTSTMPSPSGQMSPELSSSSVVAVDIAELRNETTTTTTMIELNPSVVKEQEYLVKQMESTIVGKDPLQLIQSYQSSFLPHLRERYDWVIGKCECTSTTEGHNIDLQSSLSSLHVSPVTDPIIRFENVMSVNENMDLMCTGTIHINRHYLVFSPQTSLASFDRVDIEICDITGWKLDSYIDKKIITETSDLTTLKLWLKTNPNSKESIIANLHKGEISSTDQDFNWDKDTFHELSFILEKSEINNENEIKLIEILGKPVNLEEDILIFTSPSAPQNTPMSPLILNNNSKLLPSYSPPSYLNSLLLSENNNHINNNNNNTNNEISTSTNNNIPPTSTSFIDQLTTTMVAQVLPSSKINENELIKEKVNCVFEYGKVSGTLTLMPHWLIFQADPNHPLVKKLGSIKFQLNYTMNQVMSCGMVPKTFLSPTIDDPLQFGMDDETTTSSGNSNSQASTSSTINTSNSIIPPPSPSPSPLSQPTTITNNNNSNSQTIPSTTNSNSQEMSSVHVVLQITPLVEKDILIECEDEKSQFICNQIRLWMGDLKEKTIESSIIIDNVGPNDTLSPPPRLTKEPSKSNLYQSVLMLSTSMVDRYLERSSATSTYNIEGEIPFSDPQVDSFVPDLLNGTSTMLSMSDISQLIVDLPIFYKLRNWTLLYKAEKHGISINTMYSKCKEKGGCLLVIQDSNKNIFGGFLSDSIHPSKNYYGDGECFLFRMKPFYSSYHWSKENDCFIQTTEKYLSMGGGNKGKYGLWLDDNFEQGTSQRCETYDNEPLSPNEDFLCLDIEIWGFLINLYTISVVIRNKIFQMIEELPKTIDDKKKTYIKGRELSKLSVVELVGKYGMPWSFVVRFLPPKTLGKIDVAARSSMIHNYIAHPNATVDTLRQLLDWSPDFKLTQINIPNVEILEELYQRYTEPIIFNLYYIIEIVTKNGRFEILDWLRSSRPTHGALGKHVMDSAAEHGRLDVVQWLHNNKTDGCTVSAMDKAALNGHFNIVKFLNENRTEGCSIIGMQSVVNGHLEIGQYLVEKYPKECGPSFQIHLKFYPYSQWESDPFIKAVSMGRMDIVQWLHDNRPLESAKGTIDKAVETNNLEMIKYLHSCSIDLATHKSFEWAAKNNQLEIMHWLLANTNVQEFSDAVIPLASRHATPEMLQLLNKHPATAFTPFCLDSASLSGNVPNLLWIHQNIHLNCSVAAMNMASMRGDLEMVQLLHENGIGACTDLAIDYAAENGHLQVIKYLSTNRSEGCSRRALEVAARNNHLEIIIWLLDRYPDRLCPTSASLIRAAENGHLEVVKYLFTHYADQITSSGHPYTACDFAADNGHEKVVQYLLENTTSQRFSTYGLMRASRNGHLDIVKYLTANHKMEDRMSECIMDQAAMNGKLKVVKYLSKHRTEGCTIKALKDSINNGYLNVAYYLYHNRPECNPSLLLINDIQTIDDKNINININTNNNNNSQTNNKILLFSNHPFIKILLY
ncbi:hypothetical protein DFA_00552 [Cavenderia fasciculata]|uniref:Ankyrin repeat-containing protein n=1 Tax=Cavenderia fasciculata TaxID=261658 RepID=F4PSJ9_CACFS|nr:uncharacterized protein DFA_00552 [Cavenderia fasciculata]EGG20691.1 hypothetical protein DFA_00552 [Cavenderia fasciculata]|eukprot:XP_004358541.1 hypothetical protein DFA_00552 [Cavenderia fasciculata]